MPRVCRILAMKAILVTDGGTPCHEQTMVKNVASGSYHDLTDLPHEENLEEADDSELGTRLLAVPNVDVDIELAVLPAARESASPASAASSSILYSATASIPSVALPTLSVTAAKSGPPGLVPG